jgi:hypothetical protein
MELFYQLFFFFRDENICLINYQREIEMKILVSLFFGNVSDQFVQVACSIFSQKIMKLARSWPNAIAVRPVCYEHYCIELMFHILKILA